MKRHGYANYRSWSHTRSKAFQECPRAYFYDYFFKGEEDGGKAAILKRLSTPEMLAGQQVDGTIYLALDKLKKNGQVQGELYNWGLKWYRKRVEDSAKVAERMRKGTLAPSQSQPMHHDYYGYDAKDRVERCEQRVFTTSRIRRCGKRSARLTRSIGGR